jgi:hypothetical protein
VSSASNNEKAARRRFHVAWGMIDRDRGMNCLTLIGTLAKISSLIDLAKANILSDMYKSIRILHTDGILSTMSYTCAWQQ